MRSSKKPVSASASVEQLEVRRLLSAAAHFAASHALTAHPASVTAVTSFHKGNHPKGRRLGAAAAVAASAPPAVSSVTTAAAPAPGLVDAVYHGNRAYTSAGATVPAGSPNTGLTDAAFGGDNPGATRTIQWAATHLPNYTFVNTNGSFVYGTDSSNKTSQFLGADAAGAALTDPANVNDTIFDAEGYFMTPSANDTGDISVTIAGVDDFFAVFMGGDGTPGSGTLVCSNGWQGANAGLPGYTITLPRMGADSTQPSAIPIEIIYGNGFGGAGGNGIGGTSPNTSILIVDHNGDQVNQYVQTATNEPSPDAPGALSAPLAANQNVDLTWGQAFLANSYSVYRYVTSQGAGTAVAVATGLKTTNYPATLAYTDTTVSNDVTYSYYIVATNQGGTSQSNTITVTPRASAPGAPTGVLAGSTNVPGQGVQVHVAFNTVRFGNSYVVQRAPESSPGSGTPGAFTTVPNGGNLTGSGQIFFTDTDPTLKPNVTYFYQVLAVGTFGQSTPGGPVKVAPAGNALAAEGTVEVDVRAISSPAGTTSSILNLGNQQGTFNAVGGAIAVGAVTDANSKAYQSLNFNGVNSASSTFNSPSDLNVKSSRSIELWVNNPTIDNGEETMVSWAHRGGGPDGSNMGFSYGNTYGVGLWGGGFDLTYTGNNVAGQPAAAPTANNWHYMVFTWDGTTNKVYVDGNLYLQRGTGALATFAGFPIDLAAQNSSTVAGTFTAAVNGSVDLASVRISGGALTQADINNNFKAGVPGQSAVPTLPAYITASPGAVFAYDSTAATLNLLNTGTLTFTADEASNVPSFGPPLTVSATGANASLVLQTNQHMAGLSLTDATATLPATAATALTLGGPLTLSGQGTLDLGKGSLLLPTAANVLTYLARAAGSTRTGGYNAWDGAGGLTSSVVKADAANNNANALAIGYFDSRENATTGLNLPAGDTLVKYTVYGDATADGVDDTADFTVWRNNAFTGTRWSQGDFNYDGAVDTADFTIWRNNFFKSVPS